MPSKLLLTLAAGLIASFAATHALAQASDVVCSGCIDGSDIARGAVKTNHIAVDAIFGNRIRGGAITTGKIAEGAVTGNKIAARAVNTGQIALGAVYGNRIRAQAITTGKIVPGAVTGSRLGDGAVTAAKLGIANMTFIEDGGDNMANCADLRAALDDITDNDADHRYVVVLGPGTFDCGDSSLLMKAFVDIQGSGQGATRIVGTVSSSFQGVVLLASNSELRHLTVENTRETDNAIALTVFDETNCRITNVTALAPSNGAFNEALFVSGNTAASVIVLDSELNSPDGLTLQVQNAIANVIASLVSAATNNGTLRCIASYAALDATCM